MHARPDSCPDCDDNVPGALDRRRFLGAATIAAASLPLWAVPKANAASSPSSPAETAVKELFETLSDDQRKVIAFDWDHKDAQRGILRTHVSNNWQITKPVIASNFYTKKQQDLIHDIFRGLVDPDWYPKFRKQLKDDTGGKDWGASQSIALFGKPGEKFEFVMTGRHLTIRADGNSTEHVAFGGPIFYGHAASGFNEKVHHPGNVFWHQAELANKLYQHLDPKQQHAALLEKLPSESAVDFRRGQSAFPGLSVSEFNADQKKALQTVLQSLLEPFRAEDRDEVAACLVKQGGIEKCALAFYKEEDLGDDGEWDNWRLEGPAFVWYFRGSPHVHVWVNIADDPAVPLNAQG